MSADEGRGAATSRNADEGGRLRSCRRVGHKWARSGASGRSCVFESLAFPYTFWPRRRRADHGRGARRVETRVVVGGDRGHVNDGRRAHDACPHLLADGRCRALPWGRPFADRHHRGERHVLPLRRRGRRPDGLRLPQLWRREFRACLRLLR
jgi:hypothetical protein